MRVGATLLLTAMLTAGNAAAQRAPASSPETARRAIVRSDALYEAGQCGAALAVLLDRLPDDLETSVAHEAAERICRLLRSATLTGEGDLEKASAWLLAARQAHAPESFELVEALTLRGRARAFQGQADALDYCERAERLVRRLADGPKAIEVGRCLSDHGYCAWRLGFHDRASVRYSEALWVLESYRGTRHGDMEYSRCMNNQAVVFWEAQRYDSAALCFERILGIVGKHPEERGTPFHANVLANAGIVHRSAGHPVEALAWLREALDIYRTDASSKHAVVLKNTGHVLLSLGRREEAVDHFERALRMMRRLPDIARERVTQARLDLARGYRAVGRLDDALKAVDSLVEALAEDYRDRPQRWLVSARNLSAEIALARGEFRQAAGRSEETLALCERIRPVPKTAQTEAWRLLGHARLASDQVEVALQAAEAALDLHRAVHGDVPHDRLAPILTLRGMCQSALGRDDEAAESWRAAIAAIEGQRTEATSLSDTGRSRYFEELTSGEFGQTSPYALLERLELARGDERAAFERAEQARARILLDRFAQRRDPVWGALLEARQRGDVRTVERIRELLAETEEVQSEIAELRGREPSDAVADELRRKRARLERLDDERARRIAPTTSFGRVRDLDEIRRSLRPGELLLEYSLFDDGAVLYVVAPHPEAIEAHELDAPERHLRRRVSDWLATVPRDVGRPEMDGQRERARGALPGDRVRGAGSAPAVSAELSRTLVPTEVWRRIRTRRRVFVAADGCLHRLAFDALTVDRGDGRSCPWIEIGPPVVSVASASLLCEIRERRPPPRRDQRSALDAVLVADPRPSASSASAPAASVPAAARPLAQWGALPGARREAARIAEMFPEGRARVLVGADATEAAVLDLAPTARFLHFACHAAPVHGGEPRAALFLARPGEPAGARDDGLLELEDLWHRWRGRLLATRLIVLSGCGTGDGPIGTGDGPRALPFGFLGAGATSVIATRWAVRDEASARFMTDLYENLIELPDDPLSAFHRARRSAYQRGASSGEWACYEFIGVPW